MLVTKKIKDLGELTPCLSASHIHTPYPHIHTLEEEGGGRSHVPSVGKGEYSG